MRYFHCDHLGTPIALSDDTGTIVWQATYDPWGNILEEYNPDAIEQPIRFQGQQFDPESGLHYNRHRYYDPAIGSYVTQDPIGLAGGRNTYAYPTNPLQYVDPFGLLGCDPNRDARCAQLRKQIFSKTSDLLREFAKYDPIADGKGGFPMKGGKLTKPGGHYTEMTQFQRGLKNDITEYKEKCVGNDRCNNKGPWEPIPRSTDEMANRPIDPHVFPPTPRVGASDGWTTGQILGGIFIGGVVVVGLIVAPEITIPALAVGGLAAE